MPRLQQPQRLHLHNTHTHKSLSKQPASGRNERCGVSHRCRDLCLEALLALWRPRAVRTAASKRQRVPVLFAPKGLLHCHAVFAFCQKVT